MIIYSHHRWNVLRLVHIIMYTANCNVNNLFVTQVWKIEKFQIRFEHTIDGLSHNVRALHYDPNQVNYN